MSLQVQLLEHIIDATITAMAKAASMLELEDLPLDVRLDARLGEGRAALDSTSAAFTGKPSHVCRRFRSLAMCTLSLWYRIWSKMNPDLVSAL